MYRPKDAGGARPCRICQHHPPQPRDYLGTLCLSRPGFFSMPPKYLFTFNLSRTSCLVSVTNSHLRLQTTWAAPDGGAGTCRRALVPPVQQAVHQASVSLPCCFNFATTIIGLTVLKESSLKRHGYYCRSNTRASVPRRRSCAACAKTKTACNNALPECSRCVRRGLVCYYPTRSPRQKRDPVCPATSNDLDDHLDGHANSIVPTVVEQAQNIPATTLASIDPVFEDLQWSLGDMMAFDDYMMPTPQSAVPSVTSSSPGSASPLTITPPSLLLDSTDPISDDQSKLTRQRERQHQTQRQQSLCFAISPGPSLNVRSMIQRPNMHHGAERAASLIFYTLKSYPLMLQQNDLPPFIHPSYVSSTDDGSATEPLDNCIALMHMMANGVKGSRKLFWRNVRIECERICDQNQTLNKWELLGALQALSVYILIRIDEGETEHNNLDYLLERAVIVSSMCPHV